MNTLIEHFAAIEDPRQPGKVEHRLIDILVIAVCAVIAGAESYEDIALYGRSKRAWLGRFLTLPNGIPSHDTFRRVLMLLDPDAFESCFAAWVGSFAQRLEHEVVAIDGKTLRRSFDRRSGSSPLHVVSAWASQQHLVLGQTLAGEHSNEITAIPMLLESLALEGTVVTLDAMGCQKGIAEHVLRREADYLFVLKANHSTAFSVVRDHFEAHCFRVGSGGRATFDAFDRGHGRLVRRRVFASQDGVLLEALREWPGVRTVLATDQTRSIGDSGRVEAQKRYFLSSYGGDPAVLAEAIRRHWSIENGLHWVLDVTFREDHSRVRDRRAARNLALLRKIAINVIGADSSTRGSVRGKRKMAAWDDEYMTQLLSAHFMR
jgi:predicted transposase YbfD/YdcC